MIRFGVDIAGLLAQTLGPEVEAATLVVRDPGTRTPGNLSGGTNPTSTSYSCRGFVDAFKQEQVDGTLVMADDRLVMLLAGTLPSGVLPKGGDQVTIGGRTYTIIKPLTDGLQATHELQVR